MKDNQMPFQNGFMLSLIVIAIITITWLFSPFLPSLFFAVIIAIASFSSFIKLSNKIPKILAAITMSTFIVVVIIMPLSYILLVSSIEANKAVSTLQIQFNYENIRTTINAVLSWLPLPEELISLLLSKLGDNLPYVLLGVKDLIISVMQSIISASTNFIIFIIISVFTLFYLYLNGQKLAQYIKYIVPIDAKLYNILVVQFVQLSTTLVSSTFIVAIIQGVVFAVGVAFIGLPALFFGLIMAIAGFIPILGGLIVWLPISIYLFIKGLYIEGFFIIILGAVVVGIIIDNIIRPIIIRKISAKFHQPSALKHTFITVLATMAGITQLGILGLFLGPIIAAMAISIFSAYTIKYKSFLDKL